MKRVLCLWFPDWPLQRLYHAQPRLRSQPLALLAEPGRGVRRVALCSAAARAQGVVPGMPAAEALAVAGRGDTARGTSKRAPRRALQLLPLDVRADARALRRLAHDCQQFSPTVSLEEGDAPQSLQLDITGCGPVFGGEEPLVRSAVQFCAAQGWVPRAAVADTLGAAWAIVHYGPLEPLTTAQATAEFGPAGWQVVPEGQAAGWLAPLPLAALRLAEATRDLLAELGLTSIGQLASFSRGALTARLGPELLARIDQALGLAAEVLEPHRPTELPQVRWASEFPLEYPEHWLAVAEQLLHELVEQLAAQGAGLLACHGHWTCEPTEWPAGEPCPRREVTCTLRLLRASGSVRHLLEMLSLQLARQPLPGPVSALRLEVLATAPLEAQQQTLFARDRSADNRHERARLIERLSSRLGEEAVQRVQPTAEAEPGTDYRGWPWREPAGGAERKKLPTRRSARVSASATLLPVLPRPLRLARRPVPLEVWSVVPDGPPRQVRLGTERLVLTAAWGPERIETRGWQRPAVARDYYQVETERGGRWWIFCRRSDGRWFLHGWFD